MKIVILHHHLKGGGVTRIIESQIKSLLLSGMNKEDISVLSGSVPQEARIPGISYTVAPELDYLFREEVDSLDLNKALAKIKSILMTAVEKDAILHMHNYGLGKNPLVTYAVYQLITDGYRVINHCHDFAEDRPANMAFFESVLTDHFGDGVDDVLYPVKDNLLYGIINRRDKNRTCAKGVPENSVHYLPNPVDPSEFSKALENKAVLKEEMCKQLGIDSGKKLVTYPVRIIRRKNVQEVLLLSILFGNDITIAVSLGPDSPIEVEYYRYWKDFSQRHNLPVLFDVAEKVDFRDLVAGSDFCITTSTMEGFGMTFLEPWLVDTPVVGRDLPTVTTDFIRAGVLFSGLYSAITVKSYSNSDFKDLSREECTNLLEDLIASDKERKRLQQDNPKVAVLFSDIPASAIQKNRTVITQKYSLKNYGTLLNELYKRLS